MHKILNVINNAIVINLLIGFFYSSVLAIFIFHLTNLYNEKRQLLSMKTDLNRYLLLHKVILESIEKISNIDCNKFRRYFYAFLDNTELEKDNSIPEVILFDKIAKLPMLNDYLVAEFFNSAQCNGITDEIDRKKSKSINKKKDLIINNNIVLLWYEDINNRIDRLNNRLDYYRDLTSKLINFNEYRDKGLFERQADAFFYCIKTITLESKRIEQSMKLLEQTINNNNNNKIEVNIKNSAKKFLFLNRCLMFLVILSILFLMIA